MMGSYDVTTENCPAAYCILRKRNSFFLKDEVYKWHLRNSNKNKLIWPVTASMMAIAATVGTAFTVVKEAVKTPFKVVGTMAKQGVVGARDGARSAGTTTYRSVKTRVKDALEKKTGSTVATGTGAALAIISSGIGAIVGGVTKGIGQAAMGAASRVVDPKLIVMQKMGMNTHLKYNKTPTSVNTSSSGDT
jgi:hypothetical protein